MKLGVPRKLHSLLGRLLLSYLIITTASALVSGEIIGLYEYRLLRQGFNPESVAAETSEKADRSARFFADASEPNVEALNLWLTAREQETQNRRRKVAPNFYTLYERYAAQDFLAIVDADGRVLAASGESRWNGANFQADERLRPVGSELLKTALAGAAGDSQKLVARDGDLRIVAVAPIFDRAGNLRGALLMRKNLPFEWASAVFLLLANWLQDFFFLLFVFIYTGLVFSFFVARHLVKRLDRIGAAAKAWSGGDFSARAIDESDDEIGLLIARLNWMAIQLRDFFELRQNLAAVEERGRLARELHDSVKQQVFALSMQLGAATRVLSATAESSNGKSGALHTRLREAEQLANQVQRELQELINELRPATGKGESLNSRLRTLAADWSRRNSVAAHIRLEKIPPLSPTCEHALFRIAQEALANVAKHAAEATRVSLELEMISAAKLQLSISDNGGGFAELPGHQGLGLKTMRERAENLPHGWFEIDSRRRSGTRVTAGCSTEKS